MYDLIRDSTLGQLFQLLGNKRNLFQDEDPNFQLPFPIPEVPQKANNENQSPDRPSSPTSEQDSIVKTEQERTLHPIKSSDGTILVSWYTTADSDNPQNWSLRKKVFVAFILCIYSFVVYVGSSIYAPSEQSIIEHFGVGPSVAALGLSVYVIGYGLGPVLWSPLSEIPIIGRNPPYVPTLGCFVLFTVLGATVDNFPGFVVLRFLQGFFGSPCLATAGASFGDMFSPVKLPYITVIWTSAATLGPSLGPIISGFSVQAEDWRWTQWEMLWASAPVFVVMFLFLPETSAPTILLRRARRLRANLNIPKIMSQSEIDQKKLSPREILFDALIKPWELNALDPAILFSTVYTALLYGIFYSFFESTPLVFPVMYGFNLGQSGLVFLSVLVCLIIEGPLYALYWRLAVERHVATRGLGRLENLLRVALVGSVMAPIGMFIFAWTSDPSIHWIAPIIGIGLTIGGIFYIVQGLFLYIPLIYPSYVASLFAANDVARSGLAAGAIHFSRPMMINLGVGRAVSILGGLLVGCALILLALYVYGESLRARSRFAVKADVQSEDSPAETEVEESKAGEV